VDESDAEDDYNVAKAAYQCLQLYAQCIGGEVVAPVLSFVEANLRSEDWHNRDAAVAAFGAIMDGPDVKVLDPLVKQALPVLISMMDDSSIQVKDSAAFALSRICDFCSDSIDPDTHLQPLMSALFNGLMSSPKMAASCCLALMNLTERFVGEDGAAQNPLTRHFQDSVSSLLAVTEKEGADNQLRTAAYEVLGGFVTNAANDSLQIVATLSDVILRRLEATIPMQKQVVSVDDKITLEELQTSLASVLLCIIQRLEQNIAPQADRIMQVSLEVLNVTGNTSVPDTIFAVVGALTNSLEGEFLKYMESFVPYLYNALGNQEAYGLCAMAIGLVSDIVRALGEKAQPYCDTFMNYLLNNLRVSTIFLRQTPYTDFGSQSDKLNNQLKPSILQTFGDIANAIGTHFETYLTVVAQVLQQAAGVSVAPDVSFDMLDYILSLREGIMDAWGGILLAFKESPKGLSRLLFEASNALIRSSKLATALCRTHFHAFTNDRSGSKSKRGSPTSFNGCYRV
jgi:importin subunit beta-1